MDLQTLASLAQVIGVAAVIAAIGFGMVQIRQYRQQRRDAVAVELMRSIQDTEFTRSFRILLTLPEGCTAADIKARGPAVEDAAIALIAKYETLGYLVFRGIMPIELVEELVGGVGVHFWNLLKPWALELRQERNQPLMFEWYQWLAELLERRGRPSQQPAFERYNDWSAAA
jgi:hypothetical protein